VVVVGLILFFTLSRRETEKRWDDLLGVDRQAPMTAESTLTELLETGGADFAPHVLYKLADLARREKDYDRAIEMLDRLEEEYGDSLFNTLPSPDRRFSLVTLLRRRIASERDWRKEHALESPDPDTSRVALVETSKGGFWIGFYPEHSPKHVESFIALAKSGALNGTKVYAVRANRVELGGDATRDDDPLNDEDPQDEELLDPESGRYRIKQDRGAVSSMALEEGESPTRFAVVTALSDIGLEKMQTVFAKVLTDRDTAMEALDEIKNAKTYGKSRDAEHADEKYKEIPDHPVDPIVIERVSIWAGDAIEDGHEWDTSVVKKPEKKEPVEEAEKDEGDDESGEKGEDPEKEPAEDVEEKDEAEEEEPK
jgi:peptidyl-prolyl cis-trans isomerase B (cyclophilin B)